MFSERRAQLPQSWTEEGSRSVDQALILCEIVGPSTSMSTQVTCAAGIKTKKDTENCKRGYEGQIEYPYLAGKLQRAIGPIKSNDKSNS